MIEMHKLIPVDLVSDIAGLLNEAIVRYTTAYALAEKESVKDFIGYQLRQAEYTLAEIRRAPTIGVLTEKPVNADEIYQNSARRDVW